MLYKQEGEVELHSLLGESSICTAKALKSDAARPYK